MFIAYIPHCNTEQQTFEEKYIVLNYKLKSDCFFAQGKRRKAKTGGCIASKTCEAEATKLVCVHIAPKRKGRHSEEHNEKTDSKIKFNWVTCLPMKRNRSRHEAHTGDYVQRKQNLLMPL